MKYLAETSSIVFPFLPHPQESSPLSAKQRQGSSYRAKLFGPRIYLRRSSTNTPNYIREAKIRSSKNQLYSPNTSNYFREEMFAQLRTGLRLYFWFSFLSRFTDFWSLLRFVCFRNRYVPCDDLPDIDLTHWYDPGAQL